VSFVNKKDLSERDICSKYITPSLINAVNAVSLSNLIFPLPLRNEQKRIVEKTDQLMTLFDKLENIIEQSAKDSELLMQSVLKEAFTET